MTIKKSDREEQIAHYIDESLKQVFSELEKDDLPDQIIDLLSVLRAQDEELKSNK